MEFTADASGSKLFHDASPHVMNVLATENVTMNNHHYGIYYEHFKQTDALTSFFDVLSTNHDGYGDEFVSTIESKKYPIYGTQWHPEKNAFEWARNEDGTFYEAINHSNNAVEIAQYTSSFFVHETKKNNHMFDSEEQEDSYLIYNYKPVKTSGDFVQTYFLFPEK